MEVGSSDFSACQVLTILSVITNCALLVVHSNQLSLCCVEEVSFVSESIRTYNYLAGVGEVSAFEEFVANGEGDGVLFEHNIVDEKCVGHFCEPRVCAKLFKVAFGFELGISVEVFDHFN